MNGISFAKVQQPTNPEAFTPRTAPEMHQTVSTPAPAPLTAKQRRGRRKKQIIFGSIGLIVLFIVASTIWSKREKPIRVTTEKAIRKTIVQTVSATGKVQPETEVKISPEVAGEIIELPVDDGKAVKKGDLLVRIRPDSYKALVEQQEAAISAAKATNLQQKATMLKTEHDFKRAEDLFNKKLISEQEFNGAQAAYDVAKNTYESSLHEIERAEAGSSQARDQLSKTTIYSPIDGTVTVLNSKQGERLVATGQFAGTEVMRVADLSHMEARVDVNENDVVNVKLRDKGDNNADFVNQRAEKAVQKEERDKIAKVVFLKKSNKAQIVKVTTGISDDTYTEIKNGIQPGDEVISGSYSAISRKLKDGAKVAYDKEGMK